jgi:hypothetical protein
MISNWTRRVSARRHGNQATFDPPAPAWCLRYFISNPPETLPSHPLYPTLQHPYHPHSYPLSSLLLWLSHKSLPPPRTAGDKRVAEMTILPDVRRVGMQPGPRLWPRIDHECHLAVRLLQQLAEDGRWLFDSWSISHIFLNIMDYITFENGMMNWQGCERKQWLFYNTCMEAPRTQLLSSGMIFKLLTAQVRRWEPSWILSRAIS